MLGFTKCHIGVPDSLMTRHDVIGQSSNALSQCNYTVATVATIWLPLHLYVSCLIRCYS